MLQPKQTSLRIPGAILSLRSQPCPVSSWVLRSSTAAFAMISSIMKVIPVNPDSPQNPFRAEKSPPRLADERLALLHSVLESRTFAKTARLAQFLRFICTLTIEGNAREINEQRIGIHVFARSATYIASDDSIVRTQARLLRQRLEEYFEHESPDSPVIITIPKGGYVPVFEPRRVATAAPALDAASGPCAGKNQALPNTMAAPPTAAQPQEG